METLLNCYGPVLALSPLAFYLAILKATLDVALFSSPAELCINTAESVMGSLRPSIQPATVCSLLKAKPAGLCSPC